MVWKMPTAAWLPAAPIEYDNLLKLLFCFFHPQHSQLFVSLDRLTCATQRNRSKNGSLKYSSRWCSCCRRCYCWSIVVQIQALVFEWQKKMSEHQSEWKSRSRIAAISSSIGTREFGQIFFSSLQKLFSNLRIILFELTQNVAFVSLVFVNRKTHNLSLMKNGEQKNARVNGCATVGRTVESVTRGLMFPNKSLALYLAQCCTATFIV